MSASGCLPLHESAQREERSGYYGMQKMGTGRTVNGAGAAGCALLHVTPSLLLLRSVAKNQVNGSGVEFGPNVTPCLPLHLPSHPFFCYSSPTFLRNHPSSSRHILAQRQPCKWHSSPCHALSSPAASPLPPPNGTAMAVVGSSA